MNLIMSNYIDELIKLEKNIELLPNDIKKKIYYEYFYPNEPKVVAIKLSNNLFIELNSKLSKSLNIINVVPLLEKILENEYAIDYLCNNPNSTNEMFDIFKNLYDKIIKNNNKNFIRLNKINDLALSLLFTLYH